MGIAHKGWFLRLIYELYHQQYHAPTTVPTVPWHHVQVDQQLYRVPISVATAPRTAAKPIVILYQHCSPVFAGQSVDIWNMAAAAPTTASPVLRHFHDTAVSFAVQLGAFILPFPSRQFKIYKKL